MSTYFINLEMLGASATEFDLELLAQLLRRRGYKVEVGTPRKAKAPFTEREWNEVLAEVARLTK